MAMFGLPSSIRAQGTKAKACLSKLPVFAIAKLPTVVVFAAALSLLAVSSACTSEDAATGFRISIQNAPGALRPEELRIDLLSRDGFSLQNYNVPLQDVESTPDALAVVVVDLRAADPSARRLWVRARKDEVVVSQAFRSNLIPEQGQRLDVTVVLSEETFPDADGDGIPNLVDNCPEQANPEQGACPQPEDRDAGVTEEPTPDARAETVRDAAPEPEEPDAALPDAFVPPTGNLLKNPGFEQALENGAIPGWLAVTPAPGTVRSPGANVDGGVALYADPNSGGAWIQDVLDFKEGATYVLDGWGQGGSLCQIGLQLGVVFENTPFDPTAAGQWQQYGREFLAPAGINKLTVRLQAQSPATCAFDDLRLIEKSELQ